MEVGKLYHVAMPANPSVTNPRTERLRHPPVESLDLATVMKALGDPVRLEMIRTIEAEGEMICTDLYDRLGLPPSTGSYIHRQLREAGITRARAVGPKRMISIRHEDLEQRFPGLIDLVIRDA
jgi:DNA-binding transcriptional ArsR family regulator